MKMKLIGLMALVMLCVGCTERARQKSILTGGDPALATQQDVNELKKEVAELKKLVNERFDRLEKQR